MRTYNEQRESDNSLPHGYDAFRFGAKLADERLPDGLATGTLHEIYADEEDQVAAVGFGLLLAHRANRGKVVVVVQDDRCVKAFGSLYGMGLMDLGIDPNMLLLVHTRDIVGTLRSTMDALACADVGSVVVQPWRSPAELDLTASRRIAVRARQTGAMALIVRCSAKSQSSAAMSRWHVRYAPSMALAAQAPGNSTFRIALLRHRKGIAEFDACMEWNCGQQSFNDAPLPCSLPAVVAGRTSNTEIHRAA